MRALISGTAAAASGRLTVTRTSSEPASASSIHCRAVDAASAVSVIVIDWTTTGAPPPTWTCPTRTPTVLCSLAAAGTFQEYQPFMLLGSRFGVHPTPRTEKCEPLDFFPALPQQDPSNVLGSGQRQFHGLVVLGPVHDPVE